MKKIVKEITVKKIVAEPPFVRVFAIFMEGGTSVRSHEYTEISFLTDEYDQPRVGSHLLMTIEPRPANV